MALQFRRGTEAQRASTGITPASGELIHCTDSGAWYGGDGVTAGGRAMPGAIGQQVVAAPTADGVLAFDAATQRWATGLSLADLADVAGPAFDADRVIWDAGGGLYRSGLPNPAHRPVIVAAQDAALPTIARPGTLWTRGPVSDGLFFCTAAGPPATWERIAYASELPPPPSTTRLLLHMDGADGSTTFTDSSVNGFTVTPVGGIALTTERSMFGSACGRFDTNKYLQLPAGICDFGTGDFTVEMFIYRRLTSASPQPLLDTITTGGSGTRAGAFHFSINSTNNLRLYSQGATYLSGSTALPTDQWIHIALCRAGTTIRSFIDGVLEESATHSVDLNSNAGALIGRFGDATNRHLLADVDELRIKKGEAVYTSSFTPPAAPFTP